MEGDGRSALPKLSAGSAISLFWYVPLSFFSDFTAYLPFYSAEYYAENDKYRLLSQIIRELPDEILGPGAARLQHGHFQNLLSEISTVKNNGVTPQEVRSATVPQAVFERIFQMYKQEMNRNKLIDFDDMVLVLQSVGRETRYAEIMAAAFSVYSRR